MTLSLRLPAPGALKRPRAWPKPQCPLRRGKVDPQSASLPELGFFNGMAWALAGLLLAVPASALELDARLKAFATLSALPRHDVQRSQSGAVAWDGSADLRLMLRERAGPLELIVDYSAIFLAGDSLGFLSAPQTTLDQSPQGDQRRALNLTWEIEDGARHRSLHRLDRLALRYRQGDWSVTLGRQAVSWGNGMVFQPLGLFSPFAPTTVDRDYKAGDDLLLVERLFANGSDLQLLLVGRRDADGTLSGSASSAALKWRGMAGQAELEATAARHYRDRVLGLGARIPVGSALARADLAATRLSDGGWKLSGLLNLDYSLVVLERNAYLFAEYYHNGFGAGRMPETYLELKPALAERLLRGETFNLMRDYLALGANLQWHPLWNQSLALIGNLQDGSALLQTSLTFEPGDRQRLQLGWTEPLGRAGQEFGGAPLLGETATVGGASALFARWTCYF